MLRFEACLLVDNLKLNFHGDDRCQYSQEDMNLLRYFVLLRMNDISNYITIQKKKKLQLLLPAKYQLQDVLILNRSGRSSEESLVEMFNEVTVVR